MSEPTQDSLFGDSEETTVDTELHMAMHRCWGSAGMLASEMTRPDHVLATTDYQLSESMIVAGESVVMVDLARFTRMWAVASQASLYLGLEDDFGLTNEHTQGKRADLLASIREMEERETWLRRQRGDTASSDQPEASA